MSGLQSTLVQENIRGSIVDNLITVLNPDWYMKDADASECVAYFSDLNEANKVKEALKSLCADNRPLPMSAKVVNGTKIYSLPTRIINLAEIKDRVFENYEALKNLIKVDKLDKLLQEDYVGFCMPETGANKECQKGGR